MTRGKALYLAVALAAAWGAVSHAAAGAKIPEPRLTGITSKVTARSAWLVIEASEPVSYVATRPDALTVLLDFRNVGADAVTKIGKLDPKSPIAGVALEAAESMGVPVSRVRISLAQPLVHHVRSERNTVVIDFDRSSDRPPYVAPPISRQADQSAAQIEMPAIDPIATLGLSHAAPSPLAPPPSAAARQNPSPGPAAALQAPAQDQPGTPRNGRTYTGTPVSLDFQQADLRAVLRVFSEISGLNMVIDPKVQGTVDVALKDVPWDQALDIILRANGLDWRLDGTIVRIAPREVFTAEDKSSAEAAEARSAAQQLSTLTRQLSYAKGEEVAKLLKDTRTITKYGQAQVDPRTNTLIITDIPGQLAQIQTLITTLDIAQPQVEIEARIVKTTKTYARALGIQWGFNGLVDPALGNTTNLAFPNRGSLGGAAGDGRTVPAGTAVNLPAQSALTPITTAIGLALGSVNGAFNLDAALTAGERNGNVRLLSTPRVSTQNNVEAEIAQGVQVGYQTTANNTTTTAFKDAALTLKVRPQITEAGTVIMTIFVDNGSLAGEFNGFPLFNTQRANTTVLVNDGQTTVIGGIYTSENHSNNDRTPGLANVPLLKWLFRRDSLSDENSELLIFITPRITKS